MSNLLAQAINCDDPDRAARIIRDALGIESDDVVKYCFPPPWPADDIQRGIRGARRPILRAEQSMQTPLQPLRRRR